MEFALHFPKAPLDRHVESITFYAGFAPSHDREKLIPDGAIQIIVDLTDTPKKLYAGETSPVGVDFRKSWVSGMQQRWIVIEAQQQSSMMVIRFRPGGALAFVRHDATALTSAVYPLEDVLNGRAASSLRDRVLASRSVPEKFAAAEAWLLEQAGTALPLNSAAAHLAQQLGRPGLRVRDAVAETGFTERHVLSLFRRWIGVSPKQYARISRFQHLLQSLASSGAEDPGLAAPALPPPDWARVAAETGYADQSHLTHEFQAFAGTTPGAYVAAYSGLTNYLPITLAD
jgi:AraC-like DNA-binding protein